MSKASKKQKNLHPKDFKEEQTTVWSFKQRGDWATHTGEYRGNWSPRVPRNLILKYSKPGDVVLDYFCGAGTTAVEAKLLERRCIALDINEQAIELARKNLNFIATPLNSTKQQLIMDDGEDNLIIYEPELLVGDARDLSFLKNNSIDLICAHPPYANIIRYTDNKEGDLSRLDIDEFLEEMAKVAEESFRVLKPGGHCAILIGDTRRKKHVIPLGFRLIDIYLNAGFKLRELVIKRQHNCKTTGIWYANSIKYNFLLLAHEYLPIFEKPQASSSLNVKRDEINSDLFIFSNEEIFRNGNLDTLEISSVWCFSEKDFENLLYKNVINRYSNGGNYSIITLMPASLNKIEYKERNIKNDKVLLFIKSICSNNNLSYSAIEYYLKKIKEIVSQEIFNINKGGFLVIQTQDVRQDGYIEPLAKRLIDILTHPVLWLKEIIIVTYDRVDPATQHLGSELIINHQYLLVYEIR